MHTHHKCRYRVSNCSQTPEVFVAPNLAHTATDVAQMVAKGIPVSQSNQDAQYFDGTPERDAVMDIEFTRGFDINQAWEQECIARENIRHGRMAFKAKQSMQKALEDLHSIGSSAPAPAPAPSPTPSAS